MLTKLSIRCQLPVIGGEARRGTCNATPVRGWHVTTLALFNVSEIPLLRTVGDTAKRRSYDSLPQLHHFSGPMLLLLYSNNVQPMFDTWTMHFLLSKARWLNQVF